MTDHETLVENSNAFVRLRDASSRAMQDTGHDGISVYYLLRPEGVQVRAASDNHACNRTVSWTVLGLCVIDPLLDAHEHVVKAVLQAEAQSNAGC